MDKGKKKALEASGWRVGTVQEFLGLSDEENAIVELRVALALRVRKLRGPRVDSGAVRQVDQGAERLAANFP